MKVLQNHLTPPFVTKSTQTRTTHAHTHTHVNGDGGGGGGASAPPPAHPVLAWQVVDVAAVHQQVPIFGVAEGRQVTRQGHARPHIAPQRA